MTCCFANWNFAGIRVSEAPGQGKESRLPLLVTASVRVCGTGKYLASDNERRRRRDPLKQCHPYLVQIYHIESRLKSDSSHDDGEEEEEKLHFREKKCDFQYKDRMHSERRERKAENTSLGYISKRN